MEINKEELKQNDLLIDLLVDNLVVDNDSIRINNILGIKKQISNIETMNKIYEDSKKLNERIYIRKNEILLYLLNKAKELNYDLSFYDFPVPKHSYYALDLSNAENIIEEQLLSANTNEDRIEIIKDYYNGILEQQISSYSNIVNRKLDNIIPPSESQKRINEIIDEMHNNRVDIKDYSDINEYAKKVQEATEKDNKLFNQMLDEMDKEYQELEKEYEQLPKVENTTQTEVKTPSVDVDKLISDIDNKIEELERKNVNDKIRGSLIGGAIGDALGYQIEFKRGISDKEITKYENDRGVISDDTQMCLFTANALLWRETRGSLRGIAALPADAIYMAYLDWLDTQNDTREHQSISWIKEIPELNIRRAPGTTCLNALSSGKKGTIEEPINDSKGCGGIMRVAPVGLYAKDSITAGKVGAESSAITHGHPLGILPCYILASMLNMIVYNNETIEVALDKSVHQYYDEFNKFNKEDVDYLIELINKAKKLAKDNISDVEAISSLGEGWVAEETFAIAIYSCLKYSNSFQDAIVCSVNHDGDSDSTGAVVGNIMGAYLGYNAIPDYYKDNVELKNVILELADDMSVEIPVSEYSKNDDEKWLSKYLYCNYKDRQ